MADCQGRPAPLSRVNNGGKFRVFDPRPSRGRWSKKTTGPPPNGRDLTLRTLSAVPETQLFCPMPLSIGPMKSPAFGWVVLGRALRFHQIVSTRAHAARGMVAAESGEDERQVQDLPAELRKPIGQCLERLRGRPGPFEREEVRALLVDAVQALLTRP